MLENVRLVIYALSSAIPTSSLFHHAITCSRNNGNNDRHVTSKASQTKTASLRENERTSVTIGDFVT